MKVTTDEATVENGQTKLSESVSLPEREVICLLLPGLETTRKYHMRSPRLAHPEQAADFIKVVTEELPDPAL